jgi:hypothetical protein
MTVTLQPCQAFSMTLAPVGSPSSPTDVFNNPLLWSNVGIAAASGDNSTVTGTYVGTAPYPVNVGDTIYDAQGLESMAVVSVSAGAVTGSLSNGCAASSRLGPLHPGGYNPGHNSGGGTGTSAPAKKPMSTAAVAGLVVGGLGLTAGLLWGVAAIVRARAAAA